MLNNDPLLIDTHAHLNFQAFDQDRAEMIGQCLKNKIWMVNVGTQYLTSKKAVEIAQKYEEGVYAAVGLHPLHLEEQKVDESEAGFRSEFKTRGEEFDYRQYKELTHSEKVVATGEIGFDYYWKPKTKRKLEIFKEKQRNTLLRQLELARELDLPVIFHCRMAHLGLIKFLKENSELRPKKAVAHGFVGNLEELKRYLDFGYQIGFNGIIFKNIQEINFEENIKYVPLERMLVETDCPYLSPPTGEAGGDRNSPLNLKYIVQRIAQIKQLSFEETARTTVKNARLFFNI